MKTRVWRYQVAAPVREEFEREYGADGSWARLFALSPDFVDTTLYVDVTRRGSYLTVDRFVDDGAWARFRAEHAAAYLELGTQLADLTVEQEELV
jgi:hypothetical protein